MDDIYIYSESYVEDFILFLQGNLYFLDNMGWLIHKKKIPVKLIFSWLYPSEELLKKKKS